MRDMVEADLSRYDHLRLSDLWRFDSDGCRRLTLREVWVRLRRLPDDSELVIHFNDGRTRWSDSTFLLADIVHALSGKPHPARPKPPKQARDRRETPERARIRKQRIADRKRRQMARQQAESVGTE